ncbi:uncharacterized protein PGTG_05427 [Puccinia graminis f. sp. tritici CRL 75-36-700-3]|uniref:Uncharacterized protein n=1 Tax=Puccinia graminis f. sp. tritici (strain CRL 75-36-700-3 / race SCCL) TaxID=418459 RepID=E3K496_PUCGT|nr:uncharacterized protein PGTG_05427 [Puccinia graminis f. sp. tritici CRL 75-36-700-3]EFP79106.2 hypothetical protein PGTG_05427 [Puccinia graminis f. sp. tritici CRL 75-36-700-3]
MATPVGHLFQVWVAKCGIATQFSDPRGDALMTEMAKEIYWKTSRQHLRVSQSRFRASKFKFPFKNQESLGLD